MNNLTVPTQEVASRLRGPNAYKAAGSDKLHLATLKLLACIVASHATHLSDVLLTAMKTRGSRRTAGVVLVRMGGSIDDRSKRHPASLLPVGLKFMRPSIRDAVIMHLIRNA